MINELRKLGTINNINIINNINNTNNINNSKRLKESFMESLKDLATLQWFKLAREIRSSYIEAVYVGKERKDYLGLGDFFNAKLLMYLPISLFRYPLALVIKAPKFGMAIISIIVLLSFMDTDMLSLSTFGLDLQMSPTTEAVSNMIASFLILVSEIALLGRPFLTVLLAERNNIIAKNILVECIRLTEKEGDRREKTVISILGMAHCNGIKKILTEKSNVI